jgi:hypothetical protein
MAAQAQHKTRLNLLYPQGVPEPLHIKLLKWMLHSGSYVIIGIEVFVIATFAYQIKLHSDLGRLQNDINAKVEQIVSYSQEEAQIKQTQFRLETIKKNTATDLDWKKLLSVVSAQMPTRGTLSLVSFDHTTPEVGRFRISGRAPSGTDLSVFLAGLKNQTDYFNEVTLNGITLDQGMLVFVLSGTIKSGAK